MPPSVGRGAGGVQVLDGNTESVEAGEGYSLEVESIRLRFLGCSIRMEKGEASQIEYSQLVSIRHNDAVWSRDSDFIAKGGVLGKRDGDGRRQVQSNKAQCGGEANHFHDLKEREVKDCGCQRKCVSNRQVNSNSSQRALWQRTLSKR